MALKLFDNVKLSEDASSLSQAFLEILQVYSDLSRLNEESTKLIIDGDFKETVMLTLNKDTQIEVLKGEKQDDGSLYFDFTDHYPYFMHQINPTTSFARKNIMPSRTLNKMRKFFKQSMAQHDIELNEVIENLANDLETINKELYNDHDIDQINMAVYPTLRDFLYYARHEMILDENDSNANEKHMSFKSVKETVSDILRTIGQSSLEYAVYKEDMEGFDEIQLRFNPEKLEESQKFKQIDCENTYFVSKPLVRQ